MWNYSWMPTVVTGCIKIQVVFDRKRYMGKFVAYEFYSWTCICNLTSETFQPLTDVFLLFIHTHDIRGADEELIQVHIPLSIEHYSSIDVITILILGVYPLYLCSQLLLVFSQLFVGLHLILVTCTVDETRRRFSYFVFDWMQNYLNITIFLVHCAVYFV